MKQEKLLMQAVSSLYSMNVCLQQCKWGRTKRIKPNRQSVSAWCDGADGDDSQESEGEDVEDSSALAPAVNSGTVKADPRHQAQSDSEAESEEVEDEEEGDKGDAEGQAADERQHNLVASQ